VIVDALARVTATRSLDGRSAAERRDEVADAFAVRRRRAGLLQGRRVLLIDDVMTSGATVSACSEELLAAGVAAVDVLVAVRVPDPRRDVLPRRTYRRRKHRARAELPAGSAADRADAEIISDDHALANK